MATTRDRYELPEFKPFRKKEIHDIIYCKGTENASMAVDLIGGGAVTKQKVVKTDDEFAVGSEAEYKAFPPLLDGTGQCLL